MSNDRRAQLQERLIRAQRVQVTLSVLVNQSIAAQAGINPTDLQCLNLLTIEGPMSPSRLAEAMAMTKGGAVTAMVDRLEKAGYVQRTRSTTDRRLVLVEIVWGEPLRKLMSYFEPVAELTAGTLADYSDDQLEFLAAFIERGNEAFGFSPSTATTPNSNDTHQQS